MAAALMKHSAAQPDNFKLSIITGSESAQADKVTQKTSRIAAPCKPRPHR